MWLAKKKERKLVDRRWCYVRVKAAVVAGTAGHCNMMCRSVKSRQKFRQACNGIARDLSREESSSSEIKRVETANEKRRKGESESAGVSGDVRRRRGWNVKSKQSDAQREIELGERVSLFFINRPIKQERPPSMFYFVWLLLPFPPHVPFVSLSLFLASRSSLFCPVLFLSLSRIPLLVSPFLPRFISLRFSARISSSFFVARRRTLCRLSPRQREKSSLFAILFNFFARGRTPFITWAHNSSV